MRNNICHYAQIIDLYAPCIVGSSKWNNDFNMNSYCTTTDLTVWSNKILSLSDEAFLLLCLINYGKRWFAELVKMEKKVRRVVFTVVSLGQPHHVTSLSNYSLTHLCIERKREHGQMMMKKNHFRYVATFQ